MLYQNQTGNVEGTSGPDSFIYDLPLGANTTVDGREGIDRLVVDRSAEERSTFEVSGNLNSGSFSGHVVYGDYHIPLPTPYLLYSQIEDVKFVGSDFDDAFSLTIDDSHLGLLVDFDGGEGNDRLFFNFGGVTGGLSFVVDDETIVSTYGTFAGFESFTIRGGGGDDVIHTGAGDDFIWTSAGSDDVFTGSGNDSIQSESGGDTIDGGVGNDHLGADYSSSTAALVVDLGATIAVSNGTTAVNIESVNLTTGSGNDTINVTRLDVNSIHAGAGSDTLGYSNSATVDHQTLTVTGDGSSLSGDVWTQAGGTTRSMYFHEVERVVYQGGSEDNSFFLSGPFSPTAVSFDGGGGLNHVRADFSAQTGASNFVIQADGTIVSNRGQFANVYWVWLTGGTGDDVFTSLDGPDQLTGGGGNDRLEAGAGNDLLAGGTGDDQLFGGSGNDELSGEGGNDRLYGGDGTDILSGGTNADELDGGSGADSMRGGTGSDIYHVDDSGDTVEENPGEGTDEVRTALAVYSLAANVENLTATSAANHDFRDNSGNNVITGAGGNDFMRMQGGGNDTGIGGEGNDVFLFGSTMDAFDVVDGGAGTDQIALQGGAGFRFGSGVVGIESLGLLSGSDTRFGGPGGLLHSYGLTTVDENVAPGAQLVVDGAKLLAGENLTFDGFAESDGSFFIYGGRGVDMLTGGAKNDVFLFGSDNHFGASDVVDGGSAGIDQLALRGNYTLTFGAFQLLRIESLGLLSAHDTRFGPLGSNYSYTLTTHDNNVSTGVQLTVDGAKLRGTETLVFNGAAETDGTFRIFGGINGDTLTGGQNGDILQGHGGADNLRGGGGADSFRYALVSDSGGGAVDHILDFTPGSDKIDLSRIDANGNAAGDGAFSWIGSNAFNGTAAGQLRAFQQGGSNWFVQGDVDGDGNADLVIALTLQGPTPLGAGDFLL